MRGRLLCRGERGLTLIEVLVALTLLSFGLLAMVPLFAGSVKTNASSNQLTNANTLAREKLEELIGYPTTDTRLAVGNSSNAAGPLGTSTTGTGSVLSYNQACDNDLPRWYRPASEATSNAATSPGSGWFLYSYTRTYTIEQLDGDLTTRIMSPGSYVVKRITVTVRGTADLFPGLRQTKQSVYVRYRDAS